MQIKEYYMKQVYGKVQEQEHGRGQVCDKGQV